MKTWNNKCSNKTECDIGISLKVTNQTNPSIKKTGTQTVARVGSYWILIIHYFPKCKYLVHFVYYNMVLKRTNPLSHTVDKYKKKKEKKRRKKKQLK